MPRRGARRTWALVCVVALALASCASPYTRAYFARVEGRDDEAFRLMRAEAETGSPEAQSLVAWMYSAGAGVAKDEAEAARWARRGAEGGHPAGQTLLGLAYLAGSGGLARDANAARRWLAPAADQGMGTAQFFLGVIVLDQASAPEDRVQGYGWILLSRVTGVPLALDDLRRRVEDETLRRLSPAEREGARRRAREWLTRKSSEARARHASARAGGAGRMIGSGTGTVVGRSPGEVFVLTNFHVIERCARVGVSGYARATVVGSVPAFAFSSEAGDGGGGGYGDMALLKVLATGRERAAEIADGEAIAAGERVLLAGHPVDAFGRTEFATLWGRVIAFAGLGEFYLPLESTARPGFSGGPVLDSRGRLIGITTLADAGRFLFERPRNLPRNLSAAIRAAAVRAFLEMHDAPHAASSDGAVASEAELLARARAITVRVECWG